MAFPDVPALIGESQSLAAVLDQVSRLAPLDRPVLVVGERGTGKELVAARLHYLSKRWNDPLVAINCAALAESLLEDELFGHEAGAFTGATGRRAGRFEQADGGTLFLDEIASASMTVQEKILRVVEYGAFERLGGGDTIEADVRIVAAANADLPALAKEGRFRNDLLDRLSFDVVTLPPLRARGGDVALLADHFGREMAVELGWDRFPGFTPQAAAALAAYPWPGNIRELRNVVQRAVYTSAEPGTPIAAIVFDPFESPFRPRNEGVLSAPGSTLDDAAREGIGEPRRRDAPPDPRQPFDLRSALHAIERGLVEEALAAARFNRREAARHMGLTYGQLRTVLARHGL